MTVEVDDFLEHHGVLGMHWGSRKGGGSSNKPSGPSAHQQRSLARAQTKLTKVTEKTNAANERDKAIVKARENVGSSAQRLKLAKAEYKVNKHTMDKKAAHAELGKHKAAHAANVHDANLMTSTEQKAAQQQMLRSALVGAMG